MGVRPCSSRGLRLCVFKPLLLVLHMVSPLLHAQIVLHNFHWHILMFPDLCALCRTHFAVNTSYTGTLRGLGWPSEGLLGILVPSHCHCSSWSGKRMNFLNIQIYLQFWEKEKKRLKQLSWLLGRDVVFTPPKLLSHLGACVRRRSYQSLPVEDSTACLFSLSMDALPCL